MFELDRADVIKAKARVLAAEHKRRRSQLQEPLAAGEDKSSSPLPLTLARRRVPVSADLSDRRRVQEEG